MRFVFMLFDSLNCFL
jgi:hypothetical protein